MFVELTRYSPAVGLHAAITLRLEFPAAGHTVAALSVRPFALRRLSAGLSLPLLTSVGPGPPGRPGLPRRATPSHAHSALPRPLRAAPPTSDCPAHSGCHALL